MHFLHISKKDHVLVADIPLDGSKSISNRALIMQALAGEARKTISGLSRSKDTVTLQHLLQQEGDVFNAGDAGTTFRFLTAYLAIQPGTQILDGSERMRERPVGGLVEALRVLGADIACLGREGFPPLRIGPAKQPVSNQPAQISVAGTTSSQFVSALLMIGPYLPGGLELTLSGGLVSRPYVEMTINMMRIFGAFVRWEHDTIFVSPGHYTTPEYRVEADWSAASYWYALAALADTVELRLKGLQENSIQGDAVIRTFMQKFGVQTTFEQDGILLKKSGKSPAPAFQADFLECPDIAQTLAVVCAATGTAGLFSGLDTLSIKETDRIAALKQELRKTGVSFSRLPERMHKKAAPDKTFYLVEGKAHWQTPPRFATYNDHRMAMAFAAFAFLREIEIEHPQVVEKSYPQFWEHLKAAGFYLTDSTL